jgi:transaldolase / glucose-6-phosphate isomerase
MSTITKLQTTAKLREMQALGQSIWLDYIRRSFITSGELKKLIDEQGLRGVTSNPAIFEKAIGGSNDYADLLDSFGSEKLTVNEAYERIVVRDIQDALDDFSQVYRETKFRDGYVSLEVSPKLARDTQGTVAEARRLWSEVNRPNLMVKVPGTPEGMGAIEQLIGEGININVTLLFAIEAYENCAKAYIRGLEKYAAAGGDLKHMASVASFFVSRIDTAVDGLLDGKLKEAKSDEERARIQKLYGKIAIANAKLAYQSYEKLIASDQWKRLEAKGAQTQRLLWASTGTKNPKYSDVLYLDSLIGPDTVNTVPPATLDAFIDHGTVKDTLSGGAAEAKVIFSELDKTGISLKQVTDKLLDDGLKLFDEAFDKLLGAVAKHAPASDTMIPIGYALPQELRAQVDSVLADWTQNKKPSGIWKRDASLWTNKDEAKWLGWLDITEEQLANVNTLLALQHEARDKRYKYALLLGMGGSSLCNEVTAFTFGQQEGYPQLLILDSTDPAQVKAVESTIDYASTMFIVASKSGSTLEPNIFKDFFFAGCEAKLGKGEAGKRFIAITDPGSKMEQIAQRDRFARIFAGSPSIGGRYSALSNFGMAPAAMAGVDVKKFLTRAQAMVLACKSDDAKQNPGVLLGAILGTLANQKRDKLTIFTSPQVKDLGAWLEQLIAESTGKIGKGIIPVDRESVAAPDSYGSDRIFVYVKLAGAPDPQEEPIAALEKAGHPVVRIELGDIYDLGAEYFRWEIATAVAGAIIGINPFDQPDVEASKVVTRSLTEEYEQKGSLPAETAAFEDEGIKIFADTRNRKAIEGALKDGSLAGFLRAHFERIEAGDYFALLAYVEMNAQHEAALQRMRHRVRDAKKTATCLGFGPRFLHSTGQAYKGGPNSGVFLQVTADDANDVAIPGHAFTFGVVKAAQARGDFSVLAERGRRALRIHLPADVNAGLAKLDAAIAEALR